MPLSTEDRLDITELYARQAWSLDTGDVDAYVATFAPDAVLDLAAVHEGQDAIRAFAEDFRRRDAGLPGSQHHVDQMVLEGDGARCSVRAYVTRVYRMFGRGRSNTMIIWAGYYNDECVKENDRWFIKRQVGRAWEGEVVANIRRARQTAGVA